MPKPASPRYRTTNWCIYNASLRRRGSLLVWFDRDMTWFADRNGKRGRPETFSDVAIQFCLSVKVLFGLPLRQTSGMVASLLEMADLDWPVPDFSTLCRRQRTLNVQIPYRRADGPLNLLVDSTGIKFLGDGEWPARKHGVQGRRQWRKVHLAMDTVTADIRAVEFTPSRDGDSPVLPDLLSQIPADEQIGTVTADGAYDTRRCHIAIIARDADPSTRHSGNAVTPKRQRARTGLGPVGRGRGARPKVCTPDAASCPLPSSFWLQRLFGCFRPAKLYRGSAICFCSIFGACGTRCHVHGTVCHDWFRIVSHSVV
ncbi:DDE family transposase [Rhodovulum visakhapatnamense]|uniref:DDE family transposase n=1 Tax=Rhodovulum visakhapatnamense TaxID=364297 RepID=A0A4R8FAH3_9RHOB|nr:IS5 family transposase [Rhodovulum visakhapatnamense]TDX22242.1 DDE family transposase [Rhodovulum visakhapatnamense]